MSRLKNNNSLIGRIANRNLFGTDIRASIFKDICQVSHCLYKRDLLAHYGCVNAVEFSEDGTLFVSGGDDRRVLVWKTAMALSDESKRSPITMDAEHASNIFCLAVSRDNSKIISGGNDQQTIIHDTKTKKPLDYFLHDKPVYGISFQPDCQNVFATACDDGKLRIFDTRFSSQTILLASKRYPYHSIMFHPTENRLLAAANTKEGAELWDLRHPLKCLQRFPSERGAMSVCFNSTGDKLLCVRQREPPTIYSIYNSENKLQLIAEGYTNACTMKSCCFAGEKDEFAISGSDDHNIYVWNVFEGDKAHMILKGHRSIVNHVRYNSLTCLLASSGVEKMIKFWSPFALPKSTGGLDRSSAEDPKPRKRFTRDYSMILAPSPNYMSTDEDKKMLAFFDLLVERSALISSSEEETSGSTDDEPDYDEYSLSASSNSDEDSFNIESLSSSSEDEPVAGPSGATDIERRLPDQGVLRDPSDPVVFMQKTGAASRQFRRRRSSSSASS